MDICEALYKYLSTYSGITTLISTRLYPVVIPQGVTYPAVSFQKISMQRVHAFQQDTGLTSAMIQVSTWAKTDSTKKGYAHCQAVSSQIRAALQNYSGVMGGTGGVTVNAVLIESEMDDYEEASEVYVVHQEYEIWYQEV